MIPMFLPTFSTLARLSGNSSLGMFLLGPEVRGLDVNEAEHRTLRDLIRGQKFSKKRQEKLVRCMMTHFGSTEDAVPQLPKLVATAKMDASLVSMVFWRSLADQFPPNLPKTREAIDGLVGASSTFFESHKTGGLEDVLRKTRRAADESQSEHFASLAALLEKSKTDVATSIMTVEVFGLLSLISVWMAEAFSDDEKGFCDAIDQLYAVAGGEVAPSMSFSRWLTNLVKASEFDGKMDFISLAFGTKASSVREAHRFFSGEVIPPYESAMRVLENLEDAKLLSEIEERKLGVFLVLLVANSAKYIATHTELENPHAVHQIIYDMVLAVRGDLASTAKV